MCKFLLTGCLSLIGISLYAQPTLGGSRGNALDMNTAMGGFISEIDLTNYDPIGEVYLFDDWNSANLVLRNDKRVENLIVKINLQNNTVDLKDKNQIKTFTIEKLKSIELKVLIDSTVTYYHPRGFAFYQENPITGVIRILDEKGEWSLVERSFIKVFPATYVKAFDAGTPQDRYEVSEELYLVRNGSLYSTDGGRGKFLKGLDLSGKKQSKLKSFMKEEKLTNKSSSDLQRVMIFLSEGS